LACPVREYDEYLIFSDHRFLRAGFLIQKLGYHPKIRGLDPGSRQAQVALSKHLVELELRFLDGETLGWHSFSVWSSPSN